MSLKAPPPPTESRLAKACTVVQLVEALSKMPQDLPVQLEGCDWGGLEPDRGVVLKLSADGD